MSVLPPPPRQKMEVAVPPKAVIFRFQYTVSHCRRWHSSTASTTTQLKGSPIFYTKTVPFLIQILASKRNMLQTSWYYLISKTTQRRAKPCLPKTNQLLYERAMKSILLYSPDTDVSASTATSEDPLTRSRFSIIFFNPLKTNGRRLYLKAQSVPRCKHFSSRL
jgi:hypothetical protein